MPQNWLKAPSLIDHFVKIADKIWRYLISGADSIYIKGSAYVFNFTHFRKGYICVLWKLINKTSCALTASWLETFHSAHSQRSTTRIFNSLNSSSVCRYTALTSHAHLNSTCETFSSPVTTRKLLLNKATSNRTCYTPHTQITYTKTRT